jgi:hypothetical protein
MLESFGGQRYARPVTGGRSHALGETGEPAAIARQQRAVVETWLRRRDLPARRRARLEMAKGLALGQEVATIAQWSGRSRRRVPHGLGRFAIGGGAALRDAPRTGRPAKAAAASRAALIQAVETPPRDLKLPFAAWTSARLSA